MKRASGFTLIELMTVVAIMAIVATVAVISTRAATRNANLSRATFELATRLSGLRERAMEDQATYLFVGVGGNGGTNPRDCSWSNQSACVRYYILINPLAAWTLASFNPSSPATNAYFIASYFLPTGVQFLDPGALPPGVLAPGVPPKPFDAYPYFPAALSAVCAGGGRCFALQFSPNGQVSSPGSTAAGYAMALTTDAITETRGAARRGLVVAFPSGIVRTFAN